MGKKGVAVQETKEDAERKALQKIVQLKEWRMKEEKISKVNIIKINTEWRSKLRQGKAKQLAAQVEDVKQSLERRIDHQDNLLSAVEQELEDSEAQMQYAVRGQQINQEDLQRLQAHRIQVAFDHFNAELHTVESEFTTEKQKVVDKHIKDKDELASILTRIQSEFQEAEANARHDYQSQRDDARNRHLEEKQALRIQLESINEDLWRQFQKSLDEYNQSTLEIKTQFDVLKTKDTESSKIIDFQTKRLMKIQDSISSLKSKLQNNNRDYDEKLKQMKTQKDALQTQFQEMKRKMALFRGEERKKLTDLTITSSTAMGILKDRIEQAERILKLVEFSAPLETEEDHDWKRRETELDETAKQSLEKEEQNLQAMLEKSPFSPQERIAMAMFYQRYNNVYMDKFILEQRRDELLKEQLALKSKLKCYFDGMAVSDKILKEENSLFVVNGRTNALQSGDLRSVIPQIDGPQLLKIQLIEK